MSLNHVELMDAIKRVSSKISEIELKLFHIKGTLDLMAMPRSEIEKELGKLCKPYPPEDVDAKTFFERRVTPALGSEHKFAWTTQENGASGIHTNFMATITETDRPDSQGNKFVLAIDNTTERVWVDYGKGVAELKKKADEFVKDQHPRKKADAPAKFTWEGLNKSTGKHPHYIAYIMETGLSRENRYIMQVFNGHTSNDCVCMNFGDDLDKLRDIADRFAQRRTK